MMSTLDRIRIYALYILLAAVSGCLLTYGLLTGVPATNGADESPEDNATKSIEIVKVLVDDQDGISFEDDILPIFEDNCYYCHGPKKQENGFRLDVRSLAMRGGDSAEPGIVPGKSAASYLVKSIKGTHGGKQMPLKSDPLLDEEIALIERWIDLGARWPVDPDAESADPFLNRKHWSLKPIADPKVPEIEGDSWSSNAVDPFILRSLKNAGLQPTAEADRRRLIRRVFFNLHGVVPSPEQMNRYATDSRPDWYALMVDELLASPRYGERWARHWLDVVRYAETTGFETNLPRPNAFRYRDYVIRAFNEDKPYDQFILDQLAGDVTGEGAATGFIVAGPKDHVSSPDPKLTAMQRSNELADMVNATSTTFMGLTVACARCHHHKFDPILHEDYYAMVAVFEGVQHADRAIGAGSSPQEREKYVEQIRVVSAQIDAFAPLASVAPDAKPTRPGVNAARNIERFEPVKAQHVRIVINKTNSGLDPCIDDFEVYAVSESGGAPSNVALASAGGVPSISGEYGGIHQLGHLNDGHYGNARSTIAKVKDGQYWMQITLAQPQVIDRIVWGRDRTLFYNDRLAIDYRIEVATEPGQWQAVASSADRMPEGEPSSAVRSAEEMARLEDLKAKQGALEAKVAPVQAYAGTFHQPGPTHRLYRGDPSAKREVVAPDTISVLPTLGLKSDAPEQNRRAALAKSFADPDHPLTARVMVNRIWQHHFGEGIVNTPSDFGKMGAKPTHPELLDYLASRFIESGWSIKHIHRLILNSSAFRQNSVPNEQSLRVDAASTLLWRFPPRRHEAEVIRDSVLQVTGKIDLKMYGPGFSFFKPNTNYVRVYDPKVTFGPQDWRRMIYGTQIRMERDGTFGTFDCPDGAQPMPKRARSTTALQAMSLSNSPFMLQQADLFAERLQKDVGDDAKAQVGRAYVLLYGREPDAIEMDGCLKFNAEHGLAALCRVLLNTNEFLFIE